jgi:hypothetical protein
MKNFKQIFSEILIGNEGFNRLLTTIQDKLGDLSNIEVAIKINTMIFFNINVSLFIFYYKKNRINLWEKYGKNLIRTFFLHLFKIQYINKRLKMNEFKSLKILYIDDENSIRKNVLIKFFPYFSHKFILFFL